MNRRGFIASLTALFAVEAAPAQGVLKKGPIQKWYITGGHRATQGDCDVEPIVTYGANFLEAIINSGITVWPAEDWEKTEPLFRPTCKQEKP